MFWCYVARVKTMSGKFQGGVMHTNNKLLGKYKLVALTLLAGLTASCTTAPKYYSSTQVARKLSCFKWDAKNNIPREYTRYFARSGVSNGKPGDFPNEDDRYKVASTVDGKDSLLYLSVARLNALFAGKRGIYHNLFKDPYEQNSAEGNLHCSDDDPYDEEQVAISAFSTEPESPAPSSDSGQKTTPSDKGSGKSAAKDSGAYDIDATLELQTKIVISSYLYSIHPADRLDKVYTLITPLEPGVEFISVDKTEASSKPVDFGTQANTSGLTGSAIPFGMSYAQLLSATPNFTQSFSRNIRRQFATQNVEIFPLRNILLVSEDGGPAEADLSGNKSVTATIRIPAGSRICSYQTVYKFSDGKLSGRQEICHIDRIPALMGTISVERKAVSGEDTVEEADDVVKLIPFKSMVVFDLWKNPNELYGIRLGDKMVTLKNRKPVLFNHYATALNFRSWIEDKLRDSEGKQHYFASGEENIYVDASVISSTPTLCLFRLKEPDYAINIPQRNPSDYCPPAGK